VHKVLAKVYAFAEKVRSGEWWVSGQTDHNRGEHRDRQI
jgi:hypothetical protein